MARARTHAHRLRSIEQSTAEVPCPQSSLARFCVRSITALSEGQKPTPDRQQMRYRRPRDAAVAIGRRVLDLPLHPVTVVVGRWPTFRAFETQANFPLRSAKK